jgi:uncharacterized protein with PIN domain
VTENYKHHAYFRFYGVLNDFLPPQRRGQWLEYGFTDPPGIKDPIETLGVPHSEVALILVRGQPAGFRHRLQAGERVEVCPVGPWPLPATGPPLRPLLPRPPRFVVDVNLGKLTRWLRLLGFDTAWRNDYSDREVVEMAVAEGRAVLTRDRRLLFHRVIEHGLWVRAVKPEQQIREVLDRLELRHTIHPFRYCLECNGSIEPVAKAEILDRLEPLTRRYYDEFYHCRRCGRIYWQGSHYANLMKKLEGLNSHA